MTETPIVRLEIVDAEGNRREITLGDVTTIGRQTGNDVVIDDQRVSRQHALIECREGACFITDLESSNGTYLDDVRLPPDVTAPLAPGAEIKIGASSLRVVAEGERNAASGEIGPISEDWTNLAATERESQGEEAVPAGTDSPPPGQDTPATPPAGGGSADDLLPPGLDYRSRRLIGYLPGIYHTEFMSRFLGIFEAILTPIEWNIDNFDLFLDPGTTPLAFLSWLAEWFDIAFDPSWTEAQQRQLLREAHRIYARRGTRWALSRVLEIYTGFTPEIVDTGEALAPFTFTVTLPVQAAQRGREMIEQLIDAHKPTHTMYTLEFEP